MADMKYLRDDILFTSGINPRKCMKCGKCSATCPSYDEMEYHPHQFVSMVERGELEPLLESSSLYKCLSCMACVERCPRGVKPGKLIEAIRLASVRRRGQNHMTPDQIPALLDEDLPQQAIVAALRKYSR